MNTSNNYYQGSGDAADEWDDTPEAGGESSFEQRVAVEIPDGLYSVDVVDFSIFRDKSGEWRVSWWFAVAEGVFSGSTVQKFESFAPRIGWHKADLRMVLGRVPKKDELLDVEVGRTNPEIRRQIVGARLSVKQSTNRKGARAFVDFYLQRLIAPSPNRDSVETPSPREKPSLPVAETSERPETRRQSSETSQSVEKPAQSVAGWGDPDCEYCNGRGCSVCSEYAAPV